MQLSSWLKKALQHKAYPAVLQWGSLLVFTFIVYELLTGPVNARDNLGSTLVWVVWWPFLILLFFFGRIWCAVCPFSLVSDLLQRMAGNRFKVPAFLKKNGFVIMVVFLLILTLSQELFHIAESTTFTAVMLLVIVTGVTAAGVFFERRTWCRYICPLGAIAATYSRIGCVALKGNSEICRPCSSVNCYRGSGSEPGCPMFQFPRVMDTGAYCNLCGQCLKDCPQGAVDIQLRIPTSELWFIKKPRFTEALLAVLLMGIVLARNVSEYAMEEIAELGAGIPPQALSALTYVICLAIPLMLWFLAAYGASRQNVERPKVLFTRFGYAMIPVVLLSHLGHLAGEFLEEGNLIARNARLLWQKGAIPGEPAAWMGDEGALVVQIGLLTIGLLFSIFAAYRIAQAHYLPGTRLRTLLPFAIVMVLYAVVTAVLISFGEEE